MVKIPKNKNKQPKQKKVESDSDISDSEAPGNAPKIDKKQLKQISTEVTDLLASLKKEHGIEDETVVVAPKGKDKSNKNKKEAKNAKIVAPAAVKKAKGQQAEKKQLIKQEKSLENENKKQKPFKGSDGVKQEAKPIVAVQPQQNSPKKKKNKNQKRTAENAVVKTEPSEEPPTKKVKQNAAQNQTKKQKQKKNKGDAKPVIKIEPKEEAEESEDAEEESTETEDVAVKKGSYKIFKYFYYDSIDKKFLFRLQIITWHQQYQCSLEICQRILSDSSCLKCSRNLEMSCQSVSERTMEKNSFEKSSWIRCHM